MRMADGQEWGKQYQASDRPRKGQPQSQCAAGRKPNHRNRSPVRSQLVEPLFNRVRPVLPA